VSKLLIFDTWHNCEVTRVKNKKKIQKNSKKNQKNIQKYSKNAEIDTWR